MNIPSPKDIQFSEHMSAARAAFDNIKYYQACVELVEEAAKMISRNVPVDEAVRVAQQEFIIRTQNKAEVEKARKFGVLFRFRGRRENFPCARKFVVLFRF